MIDIKNRIVFLLLSLGISTAAIAQSSSYEVGEFKEIKTDILIGYYQQEGSHSAVTGGEGTEALSATMPTIIVNVPFKNGQQLSLNLGADAYTSASSDNINVNTVSGASHKDTRIHGSLDYSKAFVASGWTLGANGSFSNEFDYFSSGFGFSFLKMLNQENTQLGLSTKVFLDNWALIYPFELRGQGPLVDTDKRNSYSLSVSWAQVVNRRMKMAVFADIVRQEGLLSTPYHRVYFSDLDNGNTPRIEHLPAHKLKFPIGLRVNYFVNDWMVSRWYYRYYIDDFGVKAHTASLTLPLSISDKHTLSPFYRYYIQSATQYFASKGEHSVVEDYYTSDYDLSAFSSHNVGLEYELKVIDGILKYHIGSRPGRLERIKLRYTYYRRSDALQAHLFTLGLSFRN